MRQRLRKNCSGASKSILTKYHCRFIVPATVYGIKSLSFESRIAACMQDSVTVLIVSIVDGCSFSDKLFSFCNSKKVGIAYIGIGSKAEASSLFDGKSTSFDAVLISTCFEFNHLSLYNSIWTGFKSSEARCVWLQSKYL